MLGHKKRPDLGLRKCLCTPDLECSRREYPTSTAQVPLVGLGRMQIVRTWEADFTTADPSGAESKRYYEDFRSDREKLCNGAAIIGRLTMPSDDAV